MIKAIGMLLAFSLMTFSPAALAAGTGTNEVNISYKIQLGAEDFKLGGITAQRYGSAYVFTLRYQSGKDRLCAAVEPQSAGGAFDMVQLPVTKDWGTCQLDRTVNEVNTAKSLTLTISADREEAVKSPTTITMTNLAEDLKGLRQQSADSVTLPLLRSFVSKDVTLGNLTVRLDGDNFKFTLDYDVGAPRLISIFDPRRAAALRYMTLQNPSPAPASTPFRCRSRASPASPHSRSSS